MKNVTFDFTPEMHDTELIHYVSTTVTHVRTIKIFTSFMSLTWRNNHE